MREIWKNLPGWGGMYAVSNLGRVRSLKRVITRSNGRPCSVRGRILRANANSCGYQCVTLMNTGAKITLPVYQLVMCAFKGPTPAGMEILHGPKGQNNNQLDNLSFGTHRQNSLDMLRDGLASAKPVIRSDGVSFPSMNQGAKSVGSHAHNVSLAIRNKWKCKGYYWRLKNE